MAGPIRLPATFKSLYRLFLRTTSASVLHHTVAKRNLRKLWRPTFEVASQVITRVQHDSQAVAEQERNEKWLKVWEHRMDNTLSLLYNSAISRGLPHDLTRNLSYLVLGHMEWWRRRHFTPAQYWKPQQQLSSAQAKPDSESSRNRAEKVRQYRELDDNAWGALTEVVKLAEGTHQISLGRIEAKRNLKGRPSSLQNITYSEQQADT